MNRVEQDYKVAFFAQKVTFNYHHNVKVIPTTPLNRLLSR